MVWNPSHDSTEAMTTPLSGRLSPILPLRHNVATEKKVDEWVWCGQGEGLTPKTCLVCFTKAEAGNDKKTVDKLIKAMNGSGLYMSEKVAQSARMGRFIYQGCQLYLQL